MKSLHGFLSPYTEGAYALLRIVSGLLFAFHGMQGLFGVLLPAEYRPHLWSQGWFGSVIELVGGLLIAGGLWTTCAAFVASGTMAVAYVQFHWKFAFDKDFFPTINHGEMALVYSVLFFYLACHGSGRWSVDRARGHRQ